MWLARGLVTAELVQRIRRHKIVALSKQDQTEVNLHKSDRV